MIITAAILLYVFLDMTSGENTIYDTWVDPDKENYPDKYYTEYL